MCRGYCAGVGPRRCTFQEDVLFEPNGAARLGRSTSWGGRGAAVVRTTDVPVVLATAVLIAIGGLSVFAATRNHLLATGSSGTAYLSRDLLNLAVGLALAVPAFLVDYRQLRSAAPLAYGGLVVLLLLVLTPAGATINGAHAWFALGPVQLEPSEFSKLIVILVLAALLSERRDREVAPHAREILIALATAGLPTLLILAEPALGIALVLAAVSVTLLALSGAPARLVVGLLASALLVGVLAGSLHLLKPYQQDRFTAFTESQGATHSSTQYQIEQSKIAIGSGGLLGQGFLRGTQTDGGFIPEQQTDFIFTVSAEEGGLLGGSLLLAALGVLLWRGISIANAAPDLFGRLVAGGVTTWLAFQSFVNIGMTVGIMPVTGLPLPFVSYGGSSLFADLLGVALVLNVHRQTVLNVRSAAPASSWLRRSRLIVPGR